MLVVTGRAPGSVRFSVSAVNELCVQCLVMKCVIPGGHLKVFGKALHSLSRVGDELWFDPLENGLALRVLNSSRSAYAYVFFSSFFFQNYQRPFVHEQGQGDVPLKLNCKFSLKSLLHVFRCLNILDKNVEKCQIYLNFNSFHMVFRFFCKHGLTKTHNLAYEECESQQVVFSKTSCPNVLKIQSRVLSDVIIHFPSCQEEITLTATPMKITLKSYNEEDIGISKVMHTEVHLNPEEFINFHIGTDSEVTFCLKELRGFLSFAEATSALIMVHFNNPGKPIVFSLDDIVFEANFILATLAEVNYNTSPKSPGNSPKSSSILKECSESSTVDKNNEQSVPAGYNRSQQPSITCSSKLHTDGLHVPEKPHYTSSYQKFCTLFFGAISSEKQDNMSNRLLYSLATSSEEDEAEIYRKELSQKF
ncbi:cell cycle checkpoint control protein RAD9B [Lithobates pipiens]